MNQTSRTCTFSRQRTALDPAPAPASSGNHAPNSLRAVLRPGFLAAAVTAVVVGAGIGTDTAAAQDERLGGIWQKDLERSDAPWPGRHDRPQPNAPDVEVEIGLEGEDVAMIVTSRRRDWPTPQSVTANYVADNKPRQAPNFVGGMREVRARWRKKKFTVSYTVKIFGTEADVQEIWEITKQGDLLQTTMGRGAEGRPDIRKTYYVPADTIQ